MNSTSDNSSSMAAPPDDSNEVMHTPFNVSSCNSSNGTSNLNLTTVANITYGYTNTTGTGPKSCYYTISLDHYACGRTDYQINYCNRYSGNDTACLDDGYGGVNYGCRYGYGTSDSGPGIYISGSDSS